MNLLFLKLCPPLILLIFIYKCFKYHEKSNLHNFRWWWFYRKISCSKFDQEKLLIIRPSVVCGTEDNFTNLFSKLSILPIIPVVKMNYKFQPILVSDVADAIMKAIEAKDNHGKIYEIGGPKVITFGDMVKSIMKTLIRKDL